MVEMAEPKAGAVIKKTLASCGIDENISSCVRGLYATGTAACVVKGDVDLSGG
jgi:hypothetical protein